MSRQPSQVRRAIVSALLIAAATAVYYQIPVPGRMREVSWGILFSCGVVVLGLLILLTVARLLRAGEQARIRVLVLLLTLTVLFFSWADESVARLPDQFVSLSTKTDALYFNVSTLATVGFGDVHPVGQLARSAVTLQIIFNLIFLGTAVSVISGFFRTRARRRVPGGSGTGGSGSGGSAAGGPEHAPES
ncbi:MAG TPA: potassium channel family protein [Streptosporangiaceae bacterium]|nr:potassium channel family protein [Streptosporangiaceae bacterium]